MLLVNEQLLLEPKTHLSKVGKFARWISFKCIRFCHEVCSKTKNVLPLIYVQGLLCWEMKLRAATVESFFAYLVCSN